jgi:hypothetical protein
MKGGLLFLWLKLCYKLNYQAFLRKKVILCLDRQFEIDWFSPDKYGTIDLSLQLTPEETPF